MALATYKDLCIDANDAARLGAFWGGVLGLDRRAQMADGGRMVLAGEGDSRRQHFFRHGFGHHLVDDALQPLAQQRHHTRENFSHAASNRSRVDVLQTPVAHPIGDHSQFVDDFVAGNILIIL